MKHPVSALTIIFLLGLSTIATLSIRPVQASETVYIRADGSVDPPSAPIQRLGDTYTFTAGLVGNVVVERNDTTIDGGGYTLQGTGTGSGLRFCGHNVTVKNFLIQGFQTGIQATPDGGYGNVRISRIAGNILTNNEWGIEADYFHDGLMVGNLIEGNTYGIFLHGMRTNVTHNSIKSNSHGIDSYVSYRCNIVGNYIAYNSLGYSESGGMSGSNNTVYHNSFINNTHQAEWMYSLFDNGYPSGGNYWSDCSGQDLLSGPFQNETGSDGIGDTPYVFYEDRQDNYPLMAPLPWWHVADFNYDFRVNIYDIVIIADAYGSTPADADWNLLCDIAEPYGIIDIYDVVQACGCYGETYE